MAIKKGDWVLVAGEANECFQIIGVEGSRVVLDSGVYEPISKCTKIEDESKIYSLVRSYYDG